MLTDPNSPLRVALFTDTFYEPNGVATLSRQFAAFAQSNSFPFLLVRGGDQTLYSQAGSLETQELKRGPASFPLDKTLYCDPLLMRHRQLILQRLREFRPDLLHITGPGDLGFLGLSTSHILRIPLVASWHTNLHEYLSKRLDRTLRLLPETLRRSAAAQLERQTLRGLLRFYRTAGFTLAPNQMLVDLIHGSTRRPSFLMQHGVDLEGFQPMPQTQHADKRPFCMGYVGRLTTEKNVRLFADLERQLLGAGERDFRFLIVGEGGQQRWLEKHLRQADFPGVLRGEKLAAAYSQMDAFVFPSHTDTFGLVILEAMACGLPVVLAPHTGQRIGVEDGISGFLSDDPAASLRLLMHNPEIRLAMGRAARLFAARNSWSHVFQHLYATYAQGLAFSDTRRAHKEAFV